MKSSFKNILWEDVLIVITLILVIVYANYRDYTLSSRLGDLQQESIAAKINYDEKINLLNNNILALTTQGQSLGTRLDSSMERSSSVEDQIGKVSDTIGSLNKLIKTDPQLLQKYSKVYFLNEHYVPPSLTNINSQYVYDKGETYLFHTQVLPHLTKLIDTARSEGQNLLVISAYRSFGTQAALKHTYKVIYGAGTANKFSADQGYSEHQLGTTVDFTTPIIKATFSGFDRTIEYAWLKANAYLYGFILSYPQTNSYYEYEPWHWRFVGVALATKLHNEGKYFYDYDQRVINDFLATFFD